MISVHKFMVLGQLKNSTWGKVGFLLWGHPVLQAYPACTGQDPQLTQNNSFKHSNNTKLEGGTQLSKGRVCTVCFGKG